MILHTHSAVIFISTLAFSAIAADDDVPPTLWNWPGSSPSLLANEPPVSSTDAEFNGISSCRGGGGPNVSFSCPHLMLLSPDMLMAAENDGNEWAAYGVVGIGQTSDCGKCYQLQITSGERTLPAKTYYIVQAVNTGTDVEAGQFDILIGAGGFGLFTACSSDCQSGPVCGGGQCNFPMFSGDFNAWTPDGNCFGGGVRDASGCDALVTTPEGSRNFAEETLVHGCKAGINQNYHQNFQVNFEQVTCPTSLVQMTGIRIENENGLPSPDRNLVLQREGRTTTTQDCCKPTCGWRQNVESFTDSVFPQVYSCNREGIPLVNSNLVLASSITESSDSVSDPSVSVPESVSDPVSDVPDSVSDSVTDSISDGTGSAGSSFLHATLIITLTLLASLLALIDY